ncbi:hypothetical protein NFI96_023392 [Prochilodus magdalenae]|nr:hypothetical protein NFI96_023392 [Prochilodus magdalenae]
MADLSRTPTGPPQSSRRGRYSKVAKAERVICGAERRPAPGNGSSNFGDSFSGPCRKKPDSQNALGLRTPTGRLSVAMQASLLIFLTPTLGVLPGSCRAELQDAPGEPDADLMESPSTLLAQDQVPSAQDRSLPDLTPPTPSEMVPPTSERPGPDEPVSLHARSTEQTAVTEGGPEGEQDATAGMSSSQKLTQEQLCDGPPAVDRSCLLPVAEEEEAMPEAGQQVASAEEGTTGISKTGSEGAVTADSTAATDNEHPPSDSTRGSPPPPPSSSKKDSLTLRSRFKRDLEMSRSMEAIEEQKTQEDGEVSASTEKEGDGSVVSEDASDSAKEDNSLSPNEKEIETLEKVLCARTAKRGHSAAGMLNPRRGKRGRLDSSVKPLRTPPGYTTGFLSADKHVSVLVLAPVQAEFHRLSLGYKCDMFTLEKRLRLEERSRDLAEENVRREVSSCHGLLQSFISGRCPRDAAHGTLPTGQFWLVDDSQSSSDTEVSSSTAVSDPLTPAPPTLTHHHHALIPLCEDDNQSMEIIQRLQKNLEILIQSMTRVSSRSEMLGAIHQESRMGKAVEVMIQHVENLRRTYTKEHAELMELRETLMQNERSFGSHTERDGKKPVNSQYYKPNNRRVSLAVIPRGGLMQFDTTKDGTETEAERLSRRSPWNMVGKNVNRPPLKRFISSGGWAETDGPPLINRYETDSHSEEEQKEEPVERRSSITELGMKITSLILPAKTSANPSPTTEQATPCLVETRPAPATRSPWVWVAMLVVLAGLLALLASLVIQPAVDAAPVGTGDSWMTIQQLLWPYTGLRHNGQPPV